MTTIAEIVFWANAGCVFYVYVGYPLLVYLMSHLFPRRVAVGKFEPAVSVVITAFNEESGLRKKIENTLLIDYPREKLEIIVASDCSTDGTDAIVLGFGDRGVKLCRQPERKGKTSAQNMAVEVATGEIVLFSDATTLYDANVLRAILPNFADRTIGCVAGKLTYIDASGSDVGTGAKRYWSYETFLKENESLACSLIGASGCLYAVRKSAYVAMYPEACSDFLIATIVYRQGLRTIYEPRAMCTEETNNDSNLELRMRVRVISQTFGDLWHNRETMNPFRWGFYAIQLISHKLLRYCIPVFLLISLAASAILAVESEWFFIFLIMQVTFYAIAMLAWVLEKMKMKLPILALPLYFVLANIASVIGFYKFTRGERFAYWEPIREDFGETGH